MILETTDDPAPLLTARKRIAELEAERDGLKNFIDKQAAAVRALQRRLNRHGIDDKLPGKTERDEATT